jgi:hypothetical protein
MLTYGTGEYASYREHCECPRTAQFPAMVLGGDIRISEKQNPFSKDR